MIEVGSLVRPGLACAGQLGAVRCEVALVVGHKKATMSEPSRAKIRCSCGTADVYMNTLVNYWLQKNV